MKQVYLYESTKTVEEHIVNGPFIDELHFQDNLPQGSFSLFGHKLNSPIGVPACVLTMNAKWVEVLSKLGLDIITYKTVRSREWPANDFPNWIYVDSSDQLRISEIDKNLLGSLEPFKGQDVSTANSFGVPSFSPEVWMEDVDKSIRVLKEGQLLILSLMTSPVEGRTQVEDAKLLGSYAKQTSAEVFEINFACPNTGSHGLIYEDVPLTLSICEELKKELGDKPLLAKVGYYKKKEDLKTFMKESKGLINGISSMNTISMKVVNESGEPAFGEERLTAGVSGATIRSLAMEQIHTIQSFKRELSLPNCIVLGMGGVAKAADLQEYLNLGIDAVQTASALWNNPYLAYQFKEKYI